MRVVYNPNYGIFGAVIVDPIKGGGIYVKGRSAHILGPDENVPSSEDEGHY